MDLQGEPLGGRATDLQSGRGGLARGWAANWGLVVEGTGRGVEPEVAPWVMGVVGECWRGGDCKTKAARRRCEICAEWAQIRAF